MLAVDFSAQVTQSGDLQNIIKLLLEFLLLNMTVRKRYKERPSENRLAYS
jgi:hypothetical protein